MKRKTINLVLAYPSKRIMSVINFANELKNTAEKDLNIVIIAHSKADKQRIEQYCIGDIQVVDFEIIARAFKSTQTKIKNPFFLVSFLKKLAKFSFSSQTIKLVTFGYSDLLKEKKIAKQIILKSKFLQDQIFALSVKDSEKVTVIVAEDDRGLELSKSLLYLKNCNTNTLFVVCEIAEAATEIDLSKFPSETIQRFSWNIYRLRSQRKFLQASFNGGFYYTHEISNALRKLRIDSRFPWRIGLSQGVNRIYLRDEESISEMAELGLSTSNTKFLGDINLDVLYRMRRKSKRAKREDSTVAVVALPQFLEDRRDENLSLDDIKGFLFNILSALSKKVDEIVIVLHPKQTLENYQYLRTISNVRIADCDILTEISSADLFVATTSSTLQYAYVLEIPALIILPPNSYNNVEMQSRVKKGKYYKTICSIDDLSQFNFDELKSESNGFFASDQYTNDPIKKNFDGKIVSRFIQDIEKLIS